MRGHVALALFLLLAVAVSLMLIAQQPQEGKRDGTKGNENGTFEKNATVKISNATETGNGTETAKGKTAKNSTAKSNLTKGNETGKNITQEREILRKLVEEMIPNGTPEYGEPIGTSFDNITNSLNAMMRLDNSIAYDSLDEIEKSRYVSIGQNISCEYCCTAKTIVFADGKPACFCSHSAAMRGLAKYLVKKRKDYSDAVILDELQKWKAAYFPRETVAKKAKEMISRGELGADTLKSIPAMVGGC